MNVKHIFIIPDTVLSDVRDIEECGKFLSLNIDIDGDDVKVGFVNKPEDVEKTYTKEEAKEVFKTLLNADLGADFDTLKTHIRVCEYGDYCRFDTSKILQKYYPDIYKLMKGFKNQKKINQRFKKSLKRTNPKLYKEMMEKEKKEKLKQELLEDNDEEVLINERVKTDS